MNSPTPSLRTEILAGITTFLTMAYIVVVNPSVLSSAGTGMDFSGVMTATVLLTVTMTLFMGIYAKLPFAVAPGMGINAFFTYTIIMGRGVPWPIALGIVFWAGVVFVLVSTTPLRRLIAEAIPPTLRSAAALGIGIFITFIGFKNAGLIVADPVTFVHMGRLTPTALLSIFGLFLSIILLSKKVPAAFLISITTVTVIGMITGHVKAPEHFVSPPNFDTVFFKLDIWGALKLAYLPALLSILFTDLFDSISSYVGVAHATGLKDENGQPLRLKEGLIVDAFATMCAGLFGTSSGTTFIESAAGIEAGGRTGRTAIVTALCFLPCFFLAPLAAAVPAFATAPVLIVVGGLMFRSLSDIPLGRMEDLIPAFLTAVMIPLTFSITQGILWGFISHTLLYTVAGRRKEVTPLMYVLALISMGLLWMEYGA
jgi:AGZA family xanthine/uracil permease-like MFS transporter